MLYSSLTLLACFFSISSTQVLPSDPNYFVISTVPVNSSITTSGYLSATGTTIYDPFENQDVVYAIVNGTLTSYSANDGNPQKLGTIGVKPNVPNVLLATIPSDDIECAPISTAWSVVKDAAGYQSLKWKNPEFRTASNQATFCVTDGGAIGGKVYAVITDSPDGNCAIVTLELGD